MLTFRNKQFKNIWGLHHWYWADAMNYCHSQKDGDCVWPQCPQLRCYQQSCPLLPTPQEEEILDLDA